MRERRVINENTYSHPFFFFFPPQNLCFYQMYLALSSDFEVPTLLKILDLKTILCPPVVVGIGDFESPRHNPLVDACWGKDFPRLSSATGCSLNIVFFPKILEYSGLWPFSVFPWCQFLYTHQAGRTPALKQNWPSSEKSQNFKEKNAIFNEHPVCIFLCNFAYNLLLLYTFVCICIMWNKIFCSSGAYTPMEPYAYFMTLSFQR